jgi:hypothetical protein
MAADWIDYVADCLKDGHNPDTIRSRIETAVAECLRTTVQEGDGCQTRSDVPVRAPPLRDRALAPATRRASAGGA